MRDSNTPSSPSSARRARTMENLSDALVALVTAGFTAEQTERTLEALGADAGAIRDAREGLVGNERVSLERRISIGLHALRCATSRNDARNDALASRVVAALESGLEEPPERFRDPVTYALMNEPRVIETGHVFDESTLYDENGVFRFKTCPMTRRELRPWAFPVAFLKKELVEYKLRRLDAVLEAVAQLSHGASRDALLSAGKALLDHLGARTYVQHAARYWALRLDSLEAGPDLLHVVKALASEMSLGEIDTSSALRALFDEAVARLTAKGAATRAECDAFLLPIDVDKATEVLLDEIDRSIEQGSDASAALFARQLVRLRDVDFEGIVRASIVSGHASRLRVLLAVGADGSRKIDLDGWTVLYTAAQEGHDDIARMLIEAGADVNKAENDNWSPLHIAVRKGHESVVRTLIEAGAAVKKTTEDRCTPLYIATQWATSQWCVC